MGAGVRAVVETGRVVVSRPWVVAATLVTGVFAPVLAVLAGFVPFVGGVVFAVFVHPLLLAGLLHVSSDAVEESVGFDSYVAGVRNHYFGLLRMFILAVIIFLPVAWLSALVVFAVGFTRAVDLTAGMVFALVIFGIMVVGLQFVDASVVVDGDGASGAVEHSWEALAHHPVSVLGYTTVRLLSLAFLAGALDVFLRGHTLVTGAGNPPDVVALAGALGVTLAGYFSVAVFHAVFYREVSR